MPRATKKPRKNREGELKDFYPVSPIGEIAMDCLATSAVFVDNSHLGDN